MGISANYIVQIHTTRYLLPINSVEINFHRSGDGVKLVKMTTLRLCSFGSKLMNLDGPEVSNFQLKISV